MMVVRASKGATFQARLVMIASKSFADLSELMRDGDHPDLDGA